jgi:hypothetical protein
MGGIVMDPDNGGTPTPPPPGAARNQCQGQKAEVPGPRSCAG